MASLWRKDGINENTHPDGQSYQNLLEVMDRGLKGFAHRIAFSNMGSDLSYQQVDQLSRNFAAYLQNLRGIGVGDRVALMMPNMLAFPVACIGILRAGMVVVNTNPLYTSAEMEHQFADSGAKVLVIFAGMAHKAQQILHKTAIEHVIIADLAGLHPQPQRSGLNMMVKHVARMVPHYHIPGQVKFRKALAKGAKLPYSKPHLVRSDLAVLQYTGGTTGVAKGAMLSHGNLIANLFQSLAVIEPMLKNSVEIVITPLPLYHVYAFTCSFLGLLYHGHQNVLITNPRNIKTFIAAMKRYPFTIFSGVNSLFLTLCESRRFAELDFSHLHYVSAGGMATTSKVHAAWQKITGCPILEGYGLTEASPVICTNTWKHHRQGSVGKPLPETELRLVDDHGKEVKTGQDKPGELWVRGPQVMQGYWHKPEETAKVLTEDGWLKTGDIASIDKDGFVRIVDRKKDMILVSGFNVYPNDLEDVLSQHPAILESAVVGVADERTGERIKAFVVAKDKNLTKKMVLDHCRSHLTGYKIPKEVEFCESLPKSNVGKILRKELRTKSEHLESR